MTTLPAAPAQRSHCPPAGGSARWVALALGLIVIWALPLGWIAGTAPRMREVFQEFGVRLSSLEMVALQVGSALGSIAGLAAMALVIPTLCVAVAALVLPPRSRSGRESGGSRWPLVLIVVLGSMVAAFLLWAVYSGLMASAMMSVVDKLKR